MHQDVLRPVRPDARGADLAAKALMCAAVDDGIRGVLIRGPSGTGKSFLVRSSAGLFPGRELIEVPSGITEDQLFGGLDLERAVGGGRAAATGGLLGRAHGNVIHLDNVNLMDLRTLDMLTERIGAGEVIVEREGVSARYPLDTAAVATMDPAERDLPDTIADRFDLCVSIGPVSDVRIRADIALADLERGDGRSLPEDGAEQDAAAASVLTARRILSEMVLERDDAETVVGLCRELGVSSHRGEIAAVRTARALAALDGRTRVSDDDIGDALILCLAHRRPLPGGRAAGRAEEAPGDDGGPASDGVPGSGGTATAPPPGGCDGDGPAATAGRVADDAAATLGRDAVLARVSDFLDGAGETEALRLHGIAGVTGPRSPLSPRNTGRHRGSRIPRGRVSDPAFDATVRAAAPFQRIRERGGLSIRIEAQDIREKIRTRRRAGSFIFTVDVSGSLADRGLLGPVQNAIRSMLAEGYVKRDRVALVTFRERTAEVTVPFTRSVEQICDILGQTPAGGSTPLANALIVSGDYAANYLRKHPGEKCYIIVITDGGPILPARPGADPVEELERVAAAVGHPDIEWTVIDSGDGSEAGGRYDARVLAGLLEARCIGIGDLGEY